MAARYWVGGSGVWSDATNHWSDTSGGSPNSGFLPTAGDDVYFDSNSFSTNGYVSIAAESYCKDMDWSGIAYTITFYNNAVNGSYTGYYLNIYGSLTLSDKLILQWYSHVRSAVYLRATTSVAITSNGCLFKLYALVIDGIGGKWTLQDDFYIGSQDITNGGLLSLANGELDMNNYSLDCRSFQTLTGTKVLTMGSGILRLNNFTNYSNAGFTLNCETSTLYFGENYRMSISGTTPQALTFYNVTISGVEQVSFIVGPEFTLGIDLIILNELKLFGENATTGRLFIYPGGNQYISRHSFTAANVEVENCDFYDIIGLGSADWDLSAIPGGAGDGGGNQNIIFTAAKTSYWYSNSGNFSDITKWYSETGGAGTSNRIPMIQDTLIFDENSLNADSEVSLDISGYGQINAYGLAFALDLTVGSIYSLTKNMFGSIYLNSLCSVPVGLSLNIYGEGVYEIDINDNRISSIAETSRGVWKLVHNIQFSNGVNLRAGAFNMNGFDIICRYIIGGTGIFNMGSGTIFASEGPDTYVEVGSANFSGEDGTIIFNPTAGSSETRLHLGNTDKLKELRVNGLSTGYFRVRILNTTAGAASIDKILIDPGKKVTFHQNQTFRIKEIIADGLAGSLIEIGTYYISGVVTLPHKLVNDTLSDFEVTYCNISWSSVTGTPRVKTILGKTWASMNKAMGISKASIKKIMGIYANSTWIATNSTDSGNNTGWNITS